MQRFSPLAVSPLLCLLLSSVAPLPAIAGTQASIRIEQLSGGSVGEWTLLSENGDSISSKDPGVDAHTYTVGITEFGQTTLSVVPPAGMSARISVYRGGDLLKQINSPQYSFPLFVNDNYRFVVQYSVSREGSLGITSEPSDVRFRLKGPDRTRSGTTSAGFEKLPAGRYTVYFSSTKDCFSPAPKSVVVKAGERNVLHVTLTCEEKTEEHVDTSRISKRSIRQYVEERESKPLGERK
jgi:hypothetical protein